MLSSSSPSHKSKLKPYIPHKFSIINKSSYSTFMKQKPTVLPQFIFKNSKTPSLERKKDALRLLKATKLLKHVHHLDLSQYYFHTMIDDIPFLKSCAKRVHKTQYLSTFNSQNTEATLPRSFQVWPKYIHRLKNLTDSSSLNQFLLGFGSKSLQDLVKPRPQKHLLRYQNRLETLQIKFDRLPCDIGLLHFEKYPRSIKKLSLSDGLFFHPVPSTSLDYFKNLQALELNFHQDSSAEFLNSFLCLLPKVPHLESLSLFSPLKALPQLKESFHLLKDLTRLKHVKIHACNLIFPHSKSLLKVLMEIPLTSLYLKVRIENPKEVNLILNLLSRQAQLTSLKLHVYHKNILEPSPISRILAKIDSLDCLKHLSLTVNSRKRFSGPIRPREKRETIQLPLSNLFTKEIPLESFQIESNYVKVSNAVFFDLLKFVQRQAASLKKIKLAIGEILLDKKELKRLLKFLERIRKDIRVLKLSMIGIYNKSHLMEIIERMRTMKYLRSFNLGKFYAQVTIDAFWKGLTKILLKQGLVKFSCDASNELKKRIVSSGPNQAILRLSILKGKNLSLEKTPDFLSSKRIKNFYDFHRFYLYQE